MKLYILFMGCASVVFIGGLLWQTGAFGVLPSDLEGDEPAATTPVKKAKASAASKRLRFPEDLAPAAQARPVKETATFKPGPDPHKLAFLRPDGHIHDWHTCIPEDWRAESVHETELVVVVGTEKKIFVDENKFVNGPPIRRYIFEVTISVVEPKTGKIVGYKIFRHTPRPIGNLEAYATTMIGRSVPWSFVYQWVASMTRIGFPEEIDTTPLVREAPI
jgi:hypothetical protein